MTIHEVFHELSYLLILTLIHVWTDCQTTIKRIFRWVVLYGDSYRVILDFIKNLNATKS